MKALLFYILLLPGLSIFGQVSELSSIKEERKNLVKSNYLQVYEVKPGDLISTIIQKNLPGVHYMNLIEVLRKFNPEVKDLNFLFVGKKLYLPTENSPLIPEKLIAYDSRARRKRPRLPANLFENTLSPEPDKKEIKDRQDVQEVKGKLKNKKDTEKKVSPKEEKNLTAPSNLEESFYLVPELEFLFTSIAGTNTDNNSRLKLISKDHYRIRLKNEFSHDKYSYNLSFGLGFLKLSKPNTSNTIKDQMQYRFFNFSGERKIGNLISLGFLSNFGDEYLHQVDGALLYFQRAHSATFAGLINLNLIDSKKKNLKIGAAVGEHAIVFDEKQSSKGGEFYKAHLKASYRLKEDFRYEVKFFHEYKESSSGKYKQDTNSTGLSFSFGWSF